MRRAGDTRWTGACSASLAVSGWEGTMVKFSGRRCVPRAGLACAVATALVLTAPAPHAPSSPAALADTSPAAATAATSLSSAAASARAKATGKPVLATSMTTSTREVAANPNGTYTMTITPAPVRVERHGAWVGLDASLHTNADGTLSPAATPGSLILSGGGSGPLATMTSNGQQMSLTLPAGLPKPIISGASATYPNVTPGTDLVVTATTQGGFSDVFVVHTPAAATDPHLAQLMNAHISGNKDLTFTTNSAGEFFAASPSGHSVFIAPAPAAWDSATTAPTTSMRTPGSESASPGAVIPTTVRTPTASTALQPGRYAHQARLATALHGNTLTLTAPTTLAQEPAANYPLYLDPSYGPAVANFASVNSHFPDQSYINGAGNQGYMQVGYNGNLEGCSPCFNARSFVTLNLAGLPSGATKISAQVNFWDHWSASCTNEELDLWTTNAISTSSSNPTTWNNQPSWNSKIGSQTVSKGWSSNCPAGGIGYPISSAVQSAVSAHKSTLTLGLRIPSTQESSNDDNWKQLNGNASGEPKTTASITYDVTPSTPAGLWTSPTTNCTNTTLGDTGVDLYAPVSTTTGVNLTTTFHLWKTTDSAKTNLLTSADGVTSDTYTGASGHTAVMTLPETFYKSLSGGAITSFSWDAETSDGTLTSAWSSTCTFKWDGTRPGAPTVTVPSSPPTGSFACPLVPADATEPVGATCAFTFSPPNGTAITGYVYQLNSSAPLTVAATGSTTITLTLPKIINTLSVEALSAGANVGSQRTVEFDGTSINPPEGDGDLTDDGIPDLIMPGRPGTAFPPGLWLAPGHANGSLDTAANIGVSGLGFNSTSTPADWNGSQAATGNFCGTGTQDVMAYFPGAYDATSNPNGGGGAIVCGTGNTDPLLLAASGNQYYISPNTFSDPNDTNADTNATDLTNGGIFNSSDDATAYQLMYGIVPTGPSTGTFDTFVLPTPTSVAEVLTPGITPPGTDSNWNDWTIAAAQDVRNGTSYTDMYLWDSTTGDLYLWAGLTLDSTSVDTATALTYTQYQIASNWNTGASLTLQAADISGYGIPDLWATDPTTGKTTATLPAALTDNPALATTSSTVVVPAGAWPLTDADGSATTAADSTGLQPATLSSAAGWTSDTIRGTSLSPNATGKGYAATSTAVLDTSKSFTVSAWAYLTSTTGTGDIAAQDGSQNSGFYLQYDSAGKWALSMQGSDTGTTTAVHALSTAAPTLNTWTNIVGVYNAGSKTISLYVDGVLNSTVATPPAWNATGPFTIGRGKYLGNATDFFSGRISDVEAYQAILPTSWIAQHGTFASLYELSTAKDAVYAWSNQGSTWTQIGGAATSIYAGDAGLFAVNPGNNDLYQYSGTPNQWTQVGGPGSTWVQSNGHLYGLTTAKDGVYEWSGSGTTWTQIGGPATAIYAGDAGLFEINSADNSVYQYSGTPNQWSKISGPAAAVAVTSSSVYELSTDKSAVLQWDGGTTWTQIGNGAAALYSGGLGLYATSPTNGNLMRYSGVSGTWTLAGGPGAVFSVGANNLYALTPTQNAIMHWTGQGTIWQKIGGSAAQIAAGN